jgi:hypothetical protein
MIAPMGQGASFTGRKFSVASVALMYLAFLNLLFFQKISWRFPATCFSGGSSQHNALENLCFKKVLEIFFACSWSS